MKSQHSYVTDMNIWEVAGLAWPLIVGMLSYTAMDLTDTFFVGWLGTAELAAIGMGTVMIIVLNAFFVGFFESVKIVVAQAFGANQLDAAEQTAWQGIGLIIPASAVFLCVLLVDKEIFALFGGPPHVQALAHEFFELRVFATPFWLLTFTIGAYFQGIGNTRFPMFVNLLMCLINLALNPILIHGFGSIPAMHMEGSALATVLSSVVGAVVLLFAYVRQSSLRPKFSWDLNKKLLRVGGPMGVRFFIQMSGWSLFTSIVANMGELELAANQVTARIMCFAILPGYGISEAASILTGQCVGANRPDMVRRAFHLSVYFAALVIGCLSVLFMAIPHVFVLIFQNDPTVVAYATKLLMIAAVVQFTDAIGLATSGALNGTGDTLYTLLLSVLGSWGLLVPVAYVLGKILNMGLVGAWYALLIDSVFVMTLLIWRLYSGKWQGKAVLRSLPG